MEGISMSAHIVDLKEEKKRREHHQLMKARYGAMLLAELSLADEVAEVNNPKPD
jgi:hypothetical protein